MYVYQSEYFIEDKNKYNLDSKIKKIIQKLEALSEPIATGPIPFFKESYGKLYKGRKDDKFRYIAEFFTIEDIETLYLHRILLEDSYAYKYFYQEVNKGKKPYEPDLIAVKRYVKHRIAEEIQKKLAAKQLEPLPQEYLDWLLPLQWENDWTIYEGQEWVSRFHDDAFRKRWQTLCEIIKEITNNAPHVKSKENQFVLTDDRYEITDYIEHPKIWYIQKDERGILFSIHRLRLPIKDFVDHSRDIIFLLAPYENRPSSREVEDLINDYYPFLSTNHEETLEFNDVVRYADRVYPYYIPANLDLWYDIEMEVGVNLALSAEEEKILLSLSEHGDDGKRLPIFINGRAGSGKSTILFYLFTEYCTRLLKKQVNQGQTKDIPLFLTYSHELIKVAKDRIKKMLYRHPALDQPNIEELEALLNSLMKTFRDFLREFLPNDEEHQHYFNDVKRITYHEFRQLYHSKFRDPIRNKYSADLCWYIIRTFIKGYQLDSFLNPSDYEDVPQKEMKYISTKVYEDVFNKVWSWYAKELHEGGYWDDQDLIRAVLASGKEPRKDYCAIFCDEAQDFTRLELKFILISSAYARYDMNYVESLLNLPFAFAGDPLQTLNPTGFRWASVKAMFHEEFIQSLEIFKRHKLQLYEPKDLIYNYRSTKPIVEITNSILLMRNHLFQQQTKPQKFWGKGKLAFIPKRFNLEDIDTCILKKHIQNTIILIPCDEGGEIPFINNDPLLSKWFPDANPDNIPRNILSAIGSKGLEFERVILYKFGEEYGGYKSIEEILNVEAIDSEYFFNKFYVAATRAMRYLFVIDSNEGSENLWESLNEASLINFAENSKNPSEWKVRIENNACLDDESAQPFTVRSFLIGTNEDLPEISEDNPLRVANEFRDKGIDKENAEHMYRAASFYNAVNHTFDGSLCEAYALKFEKQFEEAGDRFIRLNKLDLAFECYWHGEIWKKLLSVQSEMGDNERELVSFMVNENDINNAVLSFSDFIEKKLSQDKMPKAMSSQWRGGIRKFLNHIESFSDSELKTNDWLRLGRIIEELGNFSYPINLSLAGRCYFNNKNYLKACQAWKNDQFTEHQDYYYAKAEIEEYPNNLEWWKKAGKKEKIYKEWQDNGGINQNNEKDWKIVAPLIAPILEERRRYWDASLIHIHWLGSNNEQIKKIISLIKIGSDFDQKEKEIKLIINYLCKHDEWKFLIQFYEKIDFGGTNDELKQELRYDITRILSKADLSSDLKNRNTAEKIFELIIKPITEDINWKIDISIENELGPAVEILGFDLSLRFYELFIKNEHDIVTFRFSRERWLANAEMKLDHQKQHSEKTWYINLLKDYSHRKRNWKLETNANRIDQGEDSLAQKVIRRISPIQGLPDEIIVEKDGEDFIFTYAEITFVVRNDRRLVKLEDQDFQSIVFDFNKLEIQGSPRLGLSEQKTSKGGVIFLSKWNFQFRFYSEKGVTVLELLSIAEDGQITITL